MKVNKPLVVVDSVNHGIEWEMMKGGDVDAAELLAHQDAPRECSRLRSRYATRVSNPLQELETRLMRLSRRGVLRDTTVLFGVRDDPFYPFEGRFDGSLKLLELLTRYQPGLVVITTRSPLLVIALPVLKRLGTRVSVQIPIETNIRAHMERYLPGQPDLAEREKFIRTLKHFQIPVTVTVRAILPYGEWRTDALPFAEYLASLEVPVFIGKMPAEKYAWPSDRRAAELLALDRRFFWLRKDAKEPLRQSLLKVGSCNRSVEFEPTELHRQLGLFEEPSSPNEAQS